jgi:hypothetical protein
VGRDLGCRSFAELAIIEGVAACADLLGQALTERADRAGMLRLLEWLAALNCSVVMLSATLPRKQRAELLRAYGAPMAETLEIAYPRVTLATPTFQQVVPLPRGTQRRVGLRRIAAGEDWAELLLAPS